MAEFDNTNRGALFKNDKKETDSHPDYKGSVNVGGVDMWLSAWLKKSKEGKTYMSLSVQPKDGAAPKSAPKRESNDGDTIPF